MSLSFECKKIISGLGLQHKIITALFDLRQQKIKICIIVNKMEGFETPKKIFTWVSIYPEADGTSRLEKMAHIAFGFVVFLSNLCGSLAHWGYLFKFISIDLKGSVFAFMGVTVFSCLTYIIITVFRLRNQICSIIDKLTDIYQSRKYFTDTFSIFIFNVNQTEF